MDVCLWVYANHAVVMDWYSAEPKNLMLRFDPAVTSSPVLGEPQPEIYNIGNVLSLNLASLRAEDHFFNHAYILLWRNLY